MTRFDSSDSCFPEVYDLVVANPSWVDFIVDLRERRGFTWRALAEEVHSQLGAGRVEGWDRLPSNQLAGIALCDAASRILGRPLT
jgi:hypothetical protein